MQSLIPVVSIIMPSYRCADTLPAALNSLLKQEEWRWEAVIVDDGSPDHSAQVAQGYAQGDCRFRLLSQANAGACAARNTGLAVARGRYVLFLDADDWLEAGALSSMVRACERKHWAAVHGAFRYAKPDGMLTQWTGTSSGNEPLFQALASSNVLSLPSCVMLRRSLLDEIGGGFDTSLAHCGDWDLWARVARADCKIGQIDDVVTGYRMRPSSLSRNPMTLLRDAQTVLRRIHGRDPRVSRPNRRYAGGADPAELSGRLAGFTFYAAALAGMQGRMDMAAAAMDTLQQWPSLSPRRIAEFLLHAACFAKCVAPDDLQPLSADDRAAMQRIISELQGRVGIQELSARVFEALGDLGFNDDRNPTRSADRERLQRPRTAADTMAFDYLRSLALNEFGSRQMGA